MSKVSNNSNYNKVSVKTDSIVEMIQELSKLGVFKEKRKPRAKRAAAAPGDIRQDNDMGPSFTQPTQIRLAPDPQGLVQNQIEDIQRKNDALVSGLRDEIQQQRQQDLLGIGYGFRTFRSAQQPGAGVYNPFEQTATIEDIPDVQEERFTESLNEGGPEAVEQRQTTTFAEEGELPPGVAFAEIGEEPVGGGQPLKPDKRLRREYNIANRKAVAREFNLGYPPPNKYSDINDIRQYYIGLLLKIGRDPNEKILNNKNDMVEQIGLLLDTIVV